MKVNKIIISLLALLLFGACEVELDFQDEINTIELTNINGIINIPSIDNTFYDNCKLISLGGEYGINNNQFKAMACSNSKVQTFILQENENVYLLSRTPIQENDTIELNVQTTAIAMVTMHPLFSPVGKEHYNDLTTLIKESSKYQDFYNEVQKTILEKKHLFDLTNENLLLSFSNLMEDLCSGFTTISDSTEYNYFLDGDAKNMIRLNNKDALDNYGINPYYIDAQINGNKLSLSTVCMTPTYVGTITLPNGQLINKVIEARSDFGILDVLNNRTLLGTPMEHIFSIDGNYKFDFSRTNELATLDFYMKIVSCILSTFGLEITSGDYDAVAIAKAVANAITNVGSGVTGSGVNITAEEWLGIACEVVIDGINSYFEWNGTWAAMGKVGKVISGSLNWYGKIKTSANLALRLAYAFDAPETINFCLCYYTNEVTTCTEASLYKVSGDEQIGYANQKLLLPLTVCVQTLGDDGFYYNSSSYHRVKFEVVSGGGQVQFETVSADTENKASTTWTLGTSGEQRVKATVVDIITNKEISEPVYFTAEVNNADVTIRLDWNKLSGNTDIDLHVIDPYGEEIYYRNMSSASGGYLDRDDVVGPGPEFVRWTNAPEGKYKIYVHYYPNGQVSSVTSFTISVNADGKEYYPVTRSISYDQMVPVGSFEVGNDYKNKQLDIDTKNMDILDKKNYPKK